MTPRAATTDLAPAWAHGYDLADLRRTAALFQAFDKPYALGAFSTIRENVVAAWRADDQLVEWPGDAGPIAAASVHVPRVRVPVSDFTGATRSHVRPGDRYVRRIALGSDVPAARARLLELLVPRPPAATWLEGWMESPIVRELAAAAGLGLVAVKIKASSELVGVWSSPGPARVSELDPADVGTLVHLFDWPADPDLVGLAAAEAAEIVGWADHYSSYNAKHAWSALTIRGYVAPDGSDPVAQIAKPSEMNKAWKAEHPGWESWPLSWSSLRDRMPRCDALLSAFAARAGADFQRVRLMRLAPGGGELTRHADITDPDAGTADGRVARIHFPLVTNPDVRFRQWTLSGSQVEARMGYGSAWYLDTRKPHLAGNYGTSPRIHLVADVVADARLRALIVAGREAEIVS